MGGHDKSQKKNKSLKKFKKGESSPKLLPNDKNNDKDHVIANLVGDNLDYLQDNMKLMAHINSLQTRMANLEQKLTELGELFLVAMRQSSLELRTSDTGGDNKDDQGGEGGSRGAGASLSGSTRLETPASREKGLME